jgi:hypothetical protein
MGIAAIEEMVASQKGVDWVMVELTGVADPGMFTRPSEDILTEIAGPIAKSFWSNEEMGDLILDGVVCVVDCRNVMKVRLLISSSYQSGVRTTCCLPPWLTEQQLGETKDASGEINDCQKSVHLLISCSTV